NSEVTIHKARPWSQVPVRDSFFGLLFIISAGGAAELKPGVQRSETPGNHHSKNERTPGRGDGIKSSLKITTVISYTATRLHPIAHGCTDKSRGYHGNRSKITTNPEAGLHQSSRSGCLHDLLDKGLTRAALR
ncbi:MAG: hypothetical protein WCD79_14545, partial [Chthoniobacteraceae bacterium]